MADFDAFGLLQPVIASRRPVAGSGQAQIEEGFDCKIPFPVGIDQVGIVFVSADDEIPHGLDRVVRDDADTREPDRSGEADRRGRDGAYGLRTCQRDLRRSEETIDFDFICLVVAANQDRNDVSGRRLVEQGLDETIR